MLIHSCSTCTKVLNRRRCPTPTLYAGIETEPNDCPEGWYERKTMSARVLAVLAEPDSSQVTMNLYRGLLTNLPKGGASHRGVSVQQPKRKTVDMGDFLD